MANKINLSVSEQSKVQTSILNVDKGSRLLTQNGRVNMANLANTPKVDLTGIWAAAPAKTEKSTGGVPSFSAGKVEKKSGVMETVFAGLNVVKQALQSGPRVAFNLAETQGAGDK